MEIAVNDMQARQNEERQQVRRVLFSGCPLPFRHNSSVLSLMQQEITDKARKYPTLITTNDLLW
ncbi:MAG: hypothetical protein LAO09_08985 [Acidobacteriia bacterium]|nr:hypothetical protein [Terriglobia bacterium]